MPPGAWSRFPGRGVAVGAWVLWAESPSETRANLAALSLWERNTLSWRAASVYVLSSCGVRGREVPPHTHPQRFCNPMSEPFGPQGWAAPLPGPGPALRSSHLPSKGSQTSAEEGARRARTLPAGGLYQALRLPPDRAQQAQAAAAWATRGCPSRPGSDSHIPGSGLAGKLGCEFRQEGGWHSGTSALRDSSLPREAPGWGDGRTGV